MLNVSDPFDTLLWLSASTSVSALTEPEMVIRRESKPKVWKIAMDSSELNGVVTQNYLMVSPRMVGRQVVNVTSFMVRVDLQKHIDFSPTSPFGGGQPGRVKRKN
ncbi:hypothetical protein CTI12_AA232560 [Artemisia annua]|uniref:Uncharacterized protein n=1 Tax=Artemisia annua TaxID=35608 RepID=A0A2U1NSC9_ARTAN|nr:hypothetical protein CTI12_AA232560 [Artemisia annua]